MSRPREGTHVDQAAVRIWQNARARASLVSRHVCESYAYAEKTRRHRRPLDESGDEDFSTEFSHAPARPLPPSYPGNSDAVSAVRGILSVVRGTRCKCARARARACMCVLSKLGSANSMNASDTFFLCSSARALELMDFERRV